MDREEKVPPGGDLEVKIFFGPYLHILRTVEELAKEEIRTIDEQIIFLLKTAIEVREKRERAGAD